MKLAIISDTHLGDSNALLAGYNEDTDKFELRDGFKNFKNALPEGGVDYLVLLGDILDFSLASYHYAYKIGQVFFNEIVTDKLAKKIIYIAGNHDADFWHTIQYEIEVINKIKSGKEPTPFRHSMPGIFDLRKNSKIKNDFFLPRVTEQESGNKYGGLFLDYITKPKTKELLPFYFAYPNIYVVDDQDCVLITHGHYLEPYWSLLGEIADDIVKDDLDIGATMDLDEFVAINFPLNQLASSGVGQSGPISQLSKELVHEVKSNNLDRVKRYISNLKNLIDKSNKLTFESIYGFIPEYFTDKFLDILEDKLLSLLKGIKTARWDQKFLVKKDVQDRFKRYYELSLLEIDEINNLFIKDKINEKIPNPNKVIFGHTHQPISLNTNKPPMIISQGQAVRIYNAGSWLLKQRNPDIYNGAELFLFDSSKGWDSISLPPYVDTNN